MKYYSDITKKMYDTIPELENAEKAVAEKNNARKQDAEKVETAFNAFVAAREAYEKTLADFCKKHGPYHKTISENDLNPVSITTLLDLLKL